MSAVITGLLASYAPAQAVPTAAFRNPVTLRTSVSAGPENQRVIFRADDLSWTAAASAASQYGATTIRSLPAWERVYLAEFSDAGVARSAAVRLSEHPEIAWAEVDGRASFSVEPNDPMFGDQLWAHSIDLPAAWSVTRGSSAITIAVVDSGVSRSHPDLQGKLLQGHDFLDGDDNPEDEIGHGTAIAGIVAAIGDNSVGIAGVALESRVLPVKVGSADGAPISVLAQGVIWAVDQGADVINLSLVTDQTSLALQDALLYAYSNGVPVVAAAGNEPDAVTYPGAYAEAISVGASTFWGTLADFSTRQNRVDLIAPGSGILAPWWSPDDGNTWTSVTGTSFAAPMVSGTIALLLAIDPTLSIEELRQLLRANALPLSGDTPIPGAGAGQLDAGAALRGILNESLIDTWEPADQPVAEQLVGRSWLWGPEVIATGFEPYAQASDGERLVRYYDKSRMEVTDPLDDRNAPWYVTNGLLARELITGQLQTGNDSFEFRGAATVAVAGDPNDPLSPAYSDLKQLLGNTPVENGALVTATVDGAGRVSADESLGRFGVFAAEFVPETDHQIASVFWDYLNSQGPIYENGELVNGRLFDPVFFATGFPITEAYWSRVLVAGERVDVLIQCFERRCLTYTPSNAPEWQVEMANVGLHYYRWRYESNGDAPPRGGEFRDG